MPKNIATSKQTGGGGFVFEDKVSAWFLANMLSNNPPFNTELGRISKIDFQVRQDGWLLDDLLLTINANEQSITKIAISVKSNTLQINSEGLAEELVNDLWSQYLNDLNAVFNKDTDYLCIVTALLSKEISTSLNKVISSAKATDSFTFLSRITSHEEGAFSQIQKKIFNSLDCPATLKTKHNVQDVEVVDLLKRIILLEFDFEASMSKDENSLKSLCRNCLSDPNQEITLYETLCNIRGHYAPLSGQITYVNLIDSLKTKFTLKGVLNHIQDWDNLKNDVTTRISLLPDKIGGKLILNRNKELEEIKSKFSSTNVVFLLGKSGYGKSVLGKQFIESKIISSKKAIWLDAQCFDGENLSKHFNLKNNIEELITKAQDSECYLYIDGIDRFFKDALKELAKVLLTALNRPSTWKILISCQSDDFGDVIERLYRNNLTINSDSYEVKALSTEDKTIIRQAYPELNDVLKQDQWILLLNNLKLLDLLIFNVSKINLSTKLIESQIIDIIWQSEVEGENGNGDQNSVFLQAFSEKQANELSLGIAKSSFSTSDISPLQLLKKNKIVYEKTDKIYFTHDLFSDWARYKLIRANDTNLKKYILSKDLASPLWCKAIRVYGNYLLDKTENSEDWIITFNSLNDKEPKEKIIQDLLLEAIIFSLSPSKYLEVLWPILKENEGAVLKRLLNRFLIKATKPNRKTLQWVKEINGLTISEASTTNREIQFSYWPPFLMFLYSHRNEIVDLCRLTVTSIAQKWLRETPPVFLYRKEMAEIVMINAEFIFNFKLGGGLVYGHLDKEIYKTFLVAYNELPKEVVELSLKLCRRAHFEKPKKENNPSVERDLIMPKSLYRKAVSMNPWPDGPYERIDNDFCDVCLNTDSLYFLMLNDSVKAKEIILACIIDPPREYIETYNSFNYKYDIHDPHQWFPPFYTRGPFLDFLTYNPTEATDLILRLVNFTTQQWAKTINEQKSILPVTIKFEEGAKKYVGDNYVYFWFRDVGNAPHVVVTALMSLEKYFYDCIDNKIDIKGLITQILKNTNSIAFIGVLNSIGKYSPDLFLNELKPFLCNSSILNWEQTLHTGAYNIEGHQMMGSSFFNRKTWDLAKKWNEMPHRRISVNQYAAHYYLNNKEIENLFNNERANWQVELEEIESKGYSDSFLNNLIAQFDKNNYELKKVGDESFYSYKEPEIVSEKLQEVRIQNNKSLDTLTFPFSCLKSLENNTILSLEEAEQLWVRIQGYISSGGSNKEQTQEYVRDSIFGGFAVLLNNRNIWINKHPDYLKFILNHTRRTIVEFQANFLELTQADIGHSWRSFMAYYLPILWSDNLKAKSTRELIGLLVVKSSYDNVKTLLDNISKYQKWSNPDFIQLQNLIIELSIGLYRFHKEANRFYHEKAREKMSKRVRSINRFKKAIGISEEFNMNKYTEKKLLNFVDGKTQVEILDWSKYRLIEPKIKHNPKPWQHDIEENMRWPGLDMELIYHSFENLPSLSDTLENTEYNHVKTIYKQLTDQIIFELGDLKDEEPHTVNNYPHDSHLKFIKKMANQLLTMKENDSSTFWIPLFKYGATAQHWVESYCSYFMLMNIDKPERSKRLLSEWEKMITFSKTCKTWSGKSVYLNHRDIKELWFALYCIRTPDIWDDNLPHFFPEAANRVLSWMSNKWFDQDVIYRLIILLRKKNSRLFIEKGIPLIQKFLESYIQKTKETPPDGYTHREFEHIDSLARTASYLWDNQKIILKENDNLYKTFKEIVTYLVSIQNGIGLDLQERILQE